MSHHPSYYQGSGGMRAALIAAIIDAARPIYKKLLDEARRALNDGHNEMAVVLSQTAAELCTEATISTLLRRRDIEALADPLLDLFSATDICNDRLRKIYETLANDKIEKAKFWLNLRTHHKRRNLIVHRGEKCSPEDARGSVEAVEQFIQHAELILKNQRDYEAMATKKDSSP